MIRAVIIEDEDFAVHRLKMLLEEMDQVVEVVAVLDGIRQAVKWLSMNTIDLIFLDINLSDGNAFKLFEQIEIKTPIIFTTAYHEYALRAFEQHSIDYLLKPVSREKLSKALTKLNWLKGDHQGSAGGNQDIKDLLEIMRSKNTSHRFMVKIGNKVKIIELNDVAYFVLDNAITFLVNWEGKRFPLDNSLKQLQQVISPQDFFRVNRQYLIRRSAIQELQYLSTVRVKVMTQPTIAEDVIVAREKLGQFKRWLGG